MSISHMRLCNIGRRIPLARERHPLGRSPQHWQTMRGTQGGSRDSALYVPRVSQWVTLQHHVARSKIDWLKSEAEFQVSRIMRRWSVRYYV